jgi:hypothetical protein
MRGGAQCRAIPAAPQAAGSVSGCSKPASSEMPACAVLIQMFARHHAGAPLRRRDRARQKRFPQVHPLPKKAAFRGGNGHKALQ